MAEVATDAHDAPQNPSEEPQLESSTYEIIQNRLNVHAEELRKRLDFLNDSRREVFGSIETKLVATERVTSSNNCVPRDLVPIGSRFVFGYNVRIGLKSETSLSDVFSVYRLEGETLHEDTLEIIGDKTFESEFKQLYKYYKATNFAKFQVIGPHLYMVFRVGKSTTDIKAFKWLIEDDTLRYIDNRSDHEVKFPSQHEFEWTRTHRDLHRTGLHPHISIEDRVFVETVGGDLTIKIEDNTEDGAGIYSEPVDNSDQVLDDADIFYAVIGNIILLKIRPYQEKDYRYIVYNEKIQQAMRLDSVADACVLLPEDHGLIFSNGYYLQTGEYKTFENQVGDLVFEKRIISPNGEDYLYVFYQPNTGDYVLLSYNMIEQKVEIPIHCNGFSFFDNGHLIYFRADEEPQKHHALQVWQTPYVGSDYQAHAKTDSYLFKIGNREIVRAMSEAHAVINLIRKDDSYSNLYIDLVKGTTDILDAYFWLDAEEAGNLKQTVEHIKDAAKAAVDEFDKVVRVRRNTEEQFTLISTVAREAITAAGTRMYQQIDDFVQSLSGLRKARGEVITLRDLKYVDLDAIQALEEEIETNADRISHRCVNFLLREDSLAPYEKRVAEQRDTIDKLEKATNAKKLEEEISDSARELEMLIDIVSNLKIEDATQRTKIIDSISAIYSHLNQARAALKKKSQELLSVEGVAEFNSQLKLMSQAVVNYLDVCDTPERCDEYLTKMMVQVEELEGKFAEFDEFVVLLADKREEIYSAFDTRKLALVEARNKRAATLQSAADRILKGIQTRVANFDSINEINSYFASDLMIDKVRDIVAELKELDDSVKVDDIQSRLKTVREDAVRQLKDRQELFVDGQNIIKFGKHKFSVNVQPLDLTTVLKDGEMCFHLTGTNFMEPIEDESFLATRSVWNQDLVSENKDVYRAEYLAYQILKSLDANPDQRVEDLHELSSDELAAYVQRFMGPRYSEGYVKGVHDHDAALILQNVLELRKNVDKLKYHVQSRALANVFWCQLDDERQKSRLIAKINAVSVVSEVFPNARGRGKYIDELAGLIREFRDANPLVDESMVSQAAGFLFEELIGDVRCVSHQAVHICRGFAAQLERRDIVARFEESLSDLGNDHVARFLLLRDWLHAFISDHADAGESTYVDEAASVLLDHSVADRHVIHADTVVQIKGLLGNHPRIEDDLMELDFNEFLVRLEQFELHAVRAFESYVQLKKDLSEKKKEELRLEEFKPRVLTSFVRNKLIDEVYLHLVGDNLAKQMGVVGEDKRTDLMGLLLLISPPGYGKTTLMEYIANRLGITFMKINGPAIGHHVTSLDPSEAPNASAREEVEKLNLSLEMGDNVMIYLDDIQHCNPEFLQKFISLCDATRRIEGVYKGKTRTYDLRGRKVCVVMAGNPYTESGDKFQIPDMLANRADTYNLGDVAGDRGDAFELSYLENCLTSNPALNVLQSRSRNDIYSIIEMATQESPQGITLEGSFSVEEINELVQVMRKLIQIRDVLLKVNQLYIESAAQADEYRTEPPFKLQGSYRDMNKMAERVVPIMNERELQVLIDSHFQNQAQTLTTGAEANLLKFKELIGQLEGEDEKRWDDIRRTFKRNLLLGGTSADDKIGQVIAQMTTFSEGLNDIRSSLDDGWDRLLHGDKKQKDEEPTMEEKLEREQRRAALDQLVAFQNTLDGIKDVLAQGVNQNESLALAQANPGKQTIEVVNRVPRAFLEVIKAQFAVLAEWMEPVHKMTETAGKDLHKLQATMDQTLVRYEEMMENLREYGLSRKRKPVAKKGKVEVIDAEITEAEIIPEATSKPKPKRKRKK